MNMYYYFCEERTAYNSTLRRVNSSTTDINKTVQCQDNAVSSSDKNSTIIVKCTPQGVWNLDDETCVCSKGFAMVVSATECSRKQSIDLDFFHKTR